MKVSITILFFLFATNSFGQNIVFDTSVKQSSLYSNRYYSKTDFNLVDTVALWNYILDTTYHGKKTDSIKAIGRLIFWRTKPFYDSINIKLYDQPWTPYITFDIFLNTDSSYCYKISESTHLFSSCVPPDVGGDIIIIGKFLFLNHSVCLSCQRYDTKVDYCRPIVNYVFSKVDRTKITTLQSLIDQFVIARGRLPERKKEK